MLTRSVNPDTCLISLTGPGVACKVFLTPHRALVRDGLTSGLGALVGVLLAPRSVLRCAWLSGPRLEAVRMWNWGVRQSDEESSNEGKCERARDRDACGPRRGL